MNSRAFVFDDGNAYEETMEPWLIERAFPSFDAFWNSVMMVTLGPTIAAMSSDLVGQLKDRVQRTMMIRSDGTVVGHGRQTAVKGWSVSV